MSLDSIARLFDSALSHRAGLKVRMGEGIRAFT
jgi:hypothetical protein